jgi:AraC-like DNA-binding protein
MQGHEFSPDYFRYISACAAQGRGTPVRSPADDAWLTGLTCGGYRIDFDPDIADGSITWRRFSPNFALGLFDLTFHERFGFDLSTAGGAGVTSLTVAASPGADFLLDGDEIADRPSTAKRARVVALDVGKSGKAHLSAAARSRFHAVSLTTFGRGDLGEFQGLLDIAGEIGEGFIQHGVTGRVAAADFSLRQVARQMLKNPFSGPVLDAYLRAKTVELLCLMRAGLLTRPAGAESIHVAAARDCIDRMIFEPLGVGAVADNLNVSARTLMRSFKAETGMTLGEYQRSRRMEIAAELLVTTELSVSQIGERIGFVETASFSRAFCKDRGVSPVAWRRKHRA